MELKEIQMAVNFNELTAKANAITVKNQPNIIGNASISLKNEFGAFITLTGFTIWKSKFGGFNVTPPMDSRSRFQYCLFDKALWEKVKKNILESYDFASIPAVKE